ncbi:hypothetical protein BGX27_003408 [Mortierella sp. AM989]|nr:hypothetical protein BGX27_003408 [Mortierella sp. AM989]
MKDPIMTLHISGSKPDKENDLFTRPIFMASFGALWYYRNDVLPMIAAESKGKLFMSTKKKASTEDDTMYVSSKEETAFMSTKEETRTTWWRILYHLIRLHCHLRIYNFVECYDFNLNFFENSTVADENLGLAALVAYKWNTIGFKYWLIRFVCQFCFYSLVVIAALLQVYHNEPSKLAGLFITIIVMAVIFLWLELLQFLCGKNRYIRFKYNFLDIGAFCLPMVASANQLVIIYQENTQGNTYLMSFSVLAVFLHMLFELRINESVCKYVTIIQNAVSEIRVFFIIFAVGIFAFTIATLHLFRACPYEGCEVPGPDEGLPLNFFYALSVIYFFMGGRWDPVSEVFVIGNWAFHIMMAIFFFFTVILMLNVLIALINKAFATGDEGWRLVWVESRLRYIESAENLSYHIPGFRQTYNWFPKHIYFSSSLQKVQKFREKYQDTKTESDLEALENWTRNGGKVDDYPEEKEEKSEEDRVKESKKNQDGEASSDDKVEELDVANPISDRKGGDASEEIKNADKWDATSNSAIATITEFSSQIVNLKSQVGDLQRQLVEQQEQTQRQLEEIKNLLSLPRQ